MSIDITTVQMNRYIQILRYFEQEDITEDDVKTFLYQDIKSNFSNNEEHIHFLKWILDQNDKFSLIIESVILTNSYNQDKEEKYLSNSELAVILNISRQTVHNWNFDNVQYRGSKRMIPISQISKYLKNSKYERAWKKYSEQC